jgi:hypothetical protein
MPRNEKNKIIERGLEAIIRDATFKTLAHTTEGNATPLPASETPANSNIS